jgi:antitoxin (DNA-binding transcriptional repressor) of toxin-antitoxin stability system
MNKIISMQDIRTSLAAIADEAERGERFIVVRRSRPAFQIGPVNAGPASGPGDEGDWLKRLFKLADEAHGNSGGWKWNREELYDRKVLR